MEELYVHGGISHTLSIGHDYAEGIVSVLLQPLHTFALDDEIVSRLWALTSYISHRFIQFVEDLIYNSDVRGPLEDFLVCSSCQDPSCSYYSNSGSVPSSFSSSSTLNNHSTIPGVHKQETFEECSAVYSRYEIIEKKLIYGSIHLILKGLELSKYCVTSALWLATAPYRFSLYCIGLLQIRVKSTISRLQIAVHGSSGDIGWMQHDPNLDPVEDGSARFLELLYAIRNGEHKLPDSYLYLLIPGLFSNHGPLYFVSTKRFFSKMGLACHIAKIHSEASVEHNSWVLKQYIEELYWGSGKRVMLLGHSKGGVDAAAALSLYWSDLKDKVAGLALVQSPYGGSPIASDIMRTGQVADRETRRIIELFLCRIIKGDIRALEDLTYHKRKEFLAQHKLPKEIPLISFHSEANVGPAVITMMSLIAHIELPWLPFPGFGVETDHDALATMTFKVPVIVPVSAALALSALHLRARYGEKSDGLVTCRDAEVPGSIVVRPDMKLDHAWMVYSTWNKNQSGPDASEMCEALLTMLVELGDCKRPVEDAMPILNFDGIA